MTLRIVRADDPVTVEQLVVVIYSAPGLGKTTISFTADSPLLLDFDKGSYRAAFRGDSVPVDSWKAAANVTKEDLALYSTVVVDTVGRALDFLTADIIRNNPKKGHGGALTLQGYGVLKSKFTAWLTSLKLLGKDVVLVAHSSEDKNGDDLIERLDVQGGSKGEIYKSADAMGRLYLVNQKRTLSFSPTDTAFGKNPGNLDPLTVPHADQDQNFLGGVIREIKDRLNQLTEAQQERQKKIADWLALFDEAKTAEDFTGLIADVKKAPKDIAAVVKGQLHKTATGKGYSFDKDAGKYVGASA